MQRTFLEFYEKVSPSVEYFRWGSVAVRLVEVTGDTYQTFAEASNTIPMPKSLSPEMLDRVQPFDMKKWRATYEINGRVITNYLTAQDKHEAKRMLFDYLEKLGKDQDRAHVVRSSEIVPVNNWNELVRLLQYSMQHDRKTRGTDTEPFGSVDTADFHLMLDLVQKHPDFVTRHLAALPQELQFYFKRAYNALSRRDLDADLKSDSPESFWRHKVRNVFNDFGTSIRKRLADVKTRNSPKPATPPPGMSPPTVPFQRPGEEEGREFGT